MVASTSWRAVLIGLAAVAALPSQHHAQPPLGDFTGSADVGAPRIRGSAAYNPVSQDYTLRAGGANMWGTRDEFQFAWRRITGDFILQARVELQGAGVDPHRKAGLMVRSGLEPDAAYVDAVVHGDGLTSLQFRRTAGGATDERQAALKAADVLQLERRGGTYILSAAKFGEPFVATRVESVDLGADVFVGLVLCSHNPDVRERARFSSVRIVKPAPEGFTSAASSRSSTSRAAGASCSIAPTSRSRRRTGRPTAAR
jgi:hypothetical protein